MAPAVMAIVVAIGVGFLLVEEAREKYFAETRSHVSDELNLLRTRLEGEIGANLRLVGGLAAVISTDPDLSQMRFNSIAERLFTNRLQLRNIGAAPDLVLRYIYPLEGNEAAIGLDYRKNEKQRAAALTARDNGDLVLAGPLTLLQGGIGIIGRYPVFAKDEDGTEFFWGLVSAVIDAEKLFAAAGVDPDLLDFEFAIRGRDGAGLSGDVFLGSEAVFEDMPVLQQVNLPVGSWYLAGRPIGGWIVPESIYWNVWIPVGLIGTAIVIPLFGIGLFQERRRRAGKGPGRGQGKGNRSGRAVAYRARRYERRFRAVRQRHADGDLQRTLQGAVSQRWKGNDPGGSLRGHHSRCG